MTKEHSSFSKYNLRDKSKLKKGKSGPPSDTDNESLYETCSDSDSSYKPKKSSKYRKNRRFGVISESENEEEDIDSDDENDEEEEDMDSEEENDKKYSRSKFRNLLKDRFPSKYLNEKIKKEEREEMEEKRNVSHKKEKKSKKYKKKEPKYESEDEDEDSEEEDSYELDNNKGKYNIIFSIGERGNYDNDYYEDEEYISEDDSSEAEESNSEDDEKVFMKEHYEKVEVNEEETKKEKKTKESKQSKHIKQSKHLKQSKHSKNSKHSKKSKHYEEDSEEEDREKREGSEKEEDIKKEEKFDIENEYLELLDLKKHLTERLSKKPKSKILLNAIEECKETIKDLIYDARKKNTKEYYKLINKDKNRTNEVDYFKNKMSNKEQLKIMKDLKEINDHIYIEKPYRLALLESKMPPKFKAIALQKLNVLRSMEPGDPEYYKIKNWVDTFMKIPFCQYKNLSINMSDGLEKCHEFMNGSKKILDDCVYGLNDSKLQIMQMVGQWVANPSAIGSAIAIHGPPGTGKTSLIKDGISKILGREFTFIALGGAGDSSFLEGHSYTYEGSSWGKIVQILIESKCMNPVIYFDELDKVSDTARGQEIIGVLTHLTDTTQNSEFHDKYFSEVNFDLSKCLFIFSYNDETKVNPILKDRMYRIQTKGYDTKEKVVICKNYLLPKIREQVSFNDTDIIIPDETLQYIITNQAFTKGEEGVRNLKRCLEIIHTKLNLFRLMKPDENFFSKDMDIKVEFPFTVSKKEADLLIKSDVSQNQSLLAMYV